MLTDGAAGKCLLAIRLPKLSGVEVLINFVVHEGLPLHHMCV